MLPLAVGTALLAFPRIGLGLTFLVFIAILGLGYEWSHYLIHSDYKPKTACLSGDLAQSPATPLQERALLVHRHHLRYRRPGAGHLSRSRQRRDVARPRRTCTRGHEGSKACLPGEGGKSPVFTQVMVAGARPRAAAPAAGPVVEAPHRQAPAPGRPAAAQAAESLERIRRPVPRVGRHSVGRHSVGYQRLRYRHRFGVVYRWRRKLCGGGGRAASIVDGGAAGAGCTACTAAGLADVLAAVGFSAGFALSPEVSCSPIASDPDTTKVTTPTPNMAPAAPTRGNSEDSSRRGVHATESSRTRRGRMSGPCVDAMAAPRASAN